MSARASWLLDEIAVAGRENLDAVHVARYDDKEDAGAAEEVHLLEEQGFLTAASTVIDMGAGTGQFSLAASPRCARVIAVDVSPVMLDRLTLNVHRRGAGNVECVHAGFLTYQHDGPPVDLVYTRYALHHLPDAWKAIALCRMADVLRPGGALRLSDVVYSFEPRESAERFDAWVGEHPIAAGPDEWSSADVAEHVRDEHSTFNWLLEPMLQRAGFRIVEAGYSDSVFARYLCIKD
ncbi:MAG TPA: class I SAM-dependent methyltransferase [Euzebya sp.]|nr:class I SAM-dependent methyltransferase [Euzebya sp.]